VEIGETERRPEDVLHDDVAVRFERLDHRAFLVRPQRLRAPDDPLVPSVGSGVGSHDALDCTRRAALLGRKIEGSPPFACVVREHA
jgi:hypothetical protein